jgi:hypothetical protein
LNKRKKILIIVSEIPANDTRRSVEDFILPLNKIKTWRMVLPSSTFTDNERLLGLQGLCISKQISNILWQPTQVHACGHTSAGNADSSHMEETPGLCSCNITDILLPAFIDQEVYGFSVFAITDLTD